MYVILAPQKKLEGAGSRETTFAWKRSARYWTRRQHGWNDSTEGAEHSSPM